MIFKHITKTGNKVDFINLQRVDVITASKKKGEENFKVLLKTSSKHIVLITLSKEKLNKLEIMYLSNEDKRKYKVINGTENEIKEEEETQGSEAEYEDKA